MKKLIFILGVALLCSQGFAQNEENDFSLGVQLRPRAEYRNGALSPLREDDDPAALISNRARMSMEYKREKLSLGVSGQYVGVWGQDPALEMNGRAMLNEAWANITPGGGLFFKVGRQSLSYDDERILGALDWHVSGRWHDALKMGYEDAQNKLHLIVAYNQNGDRLTAHSGTYYNPGGQPYKTMQTAWYQYTASNAFHISFLLMNTGLQSGTSGDPEVKNMQTFGTNVSFQPGNFQLYGSLYYQTGKTVTDRSVAAYMGAISASYQINPTWRITLASDYLSGDDGSTPDKYKAFDVLYGTHHKFYGTMDYYYPNFVRGLWDNQLAVTFKVSPKVTLALNYHYFLTTTDVTINQNTQSTSLGSEIDFQVTWNMMKDVTMVGGFSGMFGTDAMKVVKNAPDAKDFQSWAWLSLNINPKVFMAKW